MKEYILFLDESSPNTAFRNFTLAGFAIEKTYYENIFVTKVDTIKNDIFGNSLIVLHEIDIRKKSGNFIGITYNQEEELFRKLALLFDDEKLTVFGVTINCDDLDYLYHNSSQNDIYQIALQIIMENYCHFLVENNGIGSMYLESVNEVSNGHLQNLYYELKSTGTLFYKKVLLQNRLSTLNFNMKSDGNVGLQIADFLPNSVARNALGKTQKRFSFFSKIQARSYNGNRNRNDRFGIKIIP